jgi:hypothetical protein
MKAGKTTSERFPRSLKVSLLTSFLTPISIERSRLRCHQQRVASVHKGGVRVRLAGKGDELLGEILRAVPRVDLLRKRNSLRGGIRLCAEFVGAHRRQCRYDRQLGLLRRHLVSGAAERPAAPVKANKDRCDGTRGCTLQQTLQRVSLKD